MGDYLDSEGRFQHIQGLSPDQVIIDLNDSRSLEGLIIIAVKHIGTGDEEWGRDLVTRLQDIAKEKKWGLELVNTS